MGKFGGIRDERAKLAVAAASIALLLGSTWAARHHGAFWTGLPSSFNQVVSVMTLVVLGAVSLRRRIPRTPVLAAAAVLYLIHAAAVGATFLFGSAAEVAALSVVSVGFGGVSLGLTEFVLFTLLTRFDAPRSALAVGAGFLFANVYDALFLGASTQVSAVQWIVGGSLALAAVFVLEPFDPRMLGSIMHMDEAPEIPEASDAAASTPRNPEIAATSDTAQASPVPAAQSPANLTKRSDVVLFISSVALLMLLQGWMAHLTGLGSAGSNHFFGMSTEIVMIGVRVVALLCAVGLVQTLRPSILMPLAAYIWTAGMLLLVTVPQSVGGFENLGMTVVETGMYLLQVLALVVAVVSASRRETQGDALIAFTVAAVFSNQITRNLPLLVSEAAPSQDGMVWQACLGVALAVVVIVAYALVPSSRGARANSSKQARDDQATPDFSTSSILQAEYDFAQRFETLCATYSLSERETQVLFYALHGYTVESIADRVNVSRETVKTYASRAYRRCGVGGRQELLQLMEEQAGQ